MSPGCVREVSSTVVGLDGVHHHVSGPDQDDRILAGHSQPTSGPTAHWHCGDSVMCTSVLLLHVVDPAGWCHLFKEFHG